MDFIDIHSHVIAYWDDGAESWDDSLEMLKMAEQDGISQIICTPHILATNDLEREDEIINLWNELKNKAEQANIGIKIHLGCELYVQPDINFERKISTLAGNGTYFLVEFPMGMIPDFVANKFFDLLLDNKVPIIAHPERNGGILNQPQRAVEFVERGALMQMNAGSILGDFGTRIKALATQLLDANLIHIIATDAHDTTYRPLILSKAFKFVKENWGKERAETLFINNPHKILTAKKITTGPIQPIQNNGKNIFWRKFTSFFQK